MESKVKNVFAIFCCSACFFGKALYADCVKPELLADGSYAPIETVELQLSGYHGNGYNSGDNYYQKLPFEFSFGVINASDVEAARNPVLIILVPDGVSISQWESDDGSQCDLQPGMIVCTLQDIGQFHSPESYRSINFTAVSESSELIELRASVSSNEVDHCASNNEDTLTIPIIGAADIVELDIAIDPLTQVQTMEIGEKVLLSASITNNHEVNSATSANVYIADTDNLSVEFVEGCLQSFPVELKREETGQQCDLGDVPPGGTAEIFLEVTAVEQDITVWPALAGIRPSVSSSNHDYFDSNNEGGFIFVLTTTEVSSEPAPVTDIAQAEGVDLEVTIVGSDEVTNLTVGESVPLVIEVRNNHVLNTATRPVIDFVDPVDVNIDFPEQCVSWGGIMYSVRYRTVACVLEDIPPGGSVLISTEVQGNDFPYVTYGWPRAAGFYPVASANEDDLDSNNNGSRKLYTVQQDPTVTPRPVAPEPPILPALSNSAELPNSTEVSVGQKADNSGGGSFGLFVMLCLSLVMLILNSRDSRRIPFAIVKTK